MEFIKSTFQLFGIVFVAIIISLLIGMYKTRDVRKAVIDIERKFNVQVLRTYIVNKKWYALVLDTSTGIVMEITLFSNNDKLGTYDSFVDELFGDENE